jgi:hypothetical protein
LLNPLKKSCTAGEKVLCPMGKKKCSPYDKIRIIASFIRLSFSGFFFYAWYERYLRWDFNELGRYYDPRTDTVYTTSGFVWVIFAVVLLLPSAAALLRSLAARMKRLPKLR